MSYLVANLEDRISRDEAHISSTPVKSGLYSIIKK